MSGADYKQQKVGSLLWNSGGNTIAATNTEYLAVSHMEAIETRIWVPMNMASILRRMAVRVDPAPGGVDTITARLRINGAPGNQVVVITGVDQNGQDLVNVDALVRGDLIDVEFVSSATAQATRPKVSFDVIRI